MTVQIDTFQPEKRTLGQILSSTSPPIRVPDYQRDYSWENEQVSEFWSDLIAFGGNNPQVSLVGKEYFLGAAVLVNNGSYHLLLDGQQRLATATILLAALRDKMAEYNVNAAKQIQDQYITFEDHITGGRISKIELNIFDRAFFRDYIQSSPRVAETAPTKKSHRLIKEAYELLKKNVDEGWTAAGGGKKGFEWAAHVTQTLREHMALVTVVSNNDKSAASIFATLNDRGIGLSTVDLIRSFVLQQAPASHREEIIECWDAMFNSCGTNLAAETLIRISWVAQHGDVKTRALYKIVAEDLNAGTSPLAYSQRLKLDAALFRQFRDGDSEDSDFQENLVALRTLKFNACYPLLLATHHKLGAEERRKIAKALVAVVVRHNVVCNLDRAKLENLVYATAKLLSDGQGFENALASLRGISPPTELFEGSFAKLSFPVSEHGTGRYLLRCFDSKLATTAEVTVAGADRVHVEHIYPQNPAEQSRWQEHDRQVRRIGNLTLLDKRLNEQIKNSDFATKKEKAYKDSRLEITKALLQYESWSPETIATRQAALCGLAQEIWPVTLI
jgi:hypothetical protein